MDLSETVYALEAAARSTISEPFSDRKIFQPALRAGKSLWGDGAGEH
jgi:hypothetical protein